MKLKSTNNFLKNRNNGLGKVLLFALASFMLTLPALADDASTAQPVKTGHHHGMMRQCIQQELASQNITLPPHVRGQKPQLDAAQEAALTSARATCKAKFQAAQAGQAAAN